MVVKLLRMYGEEMTVMMHTRNNEDWTAFDLAARGGHIEIVRLLAPIHNNATPPLTEFETRAYLGRALNEAAGAGNLELSKYLLAEGADVNFHAEGYGTPLYYATPHLDLVQFLLASGADPNIRGEPFCYIPLLKTRNTDVADVLLAAGADLHAACSEGWNLVIVQIIYANLEMLRFWLERGVDPNHEDRFQKTALHYVCGTDDDFQLEDAEAYLELLLQFGAATVEKTDEDGRTPVDYAMNSNMTEAMEMLEPLVQDPDLKLRIAAWWERNLTDEEVEVGEANIN
ncbi:ankyrin repeat-containing domain protein [Mycena galopus ATCC 62051]|nr:ankyrin repeat-containing domain protein [Mycena galopus ATCC 62051]